MGKLGKDMKIAELSVNIFTPTPKANQSIRQYKKVINSSMSICTFKPEFDVDYAYIYENGIKQSKSAPCVGLFRFEKKITIKQ